MGVVGEAWNCPHCGQRILRSAVSCPGCQRRLRFDAVTAAHAAGSAIFPLRVEGTIQHPPGETPWEYSVVVQVRDAQGAVIARHVVGVGSIQPGDTRTFMLQVEMRTAEDSAHAASAAQASGSERGKQEPSPPAQQRQLRKAEPTPVAGTTRRTE